MKAFLYAIGAGALIGCGGLGYVAVESREIGALLFSVGLFSVLMLKVPLYTGRCGYMFCKNGHTLKELSVFLLGNFLGAFLVGLCAGPMKMAAKDLVLLAQNKLAQSFFQTLLRGVFCGVLVFVTVEAWNKLAGAERSLGVLLAVPVFILAGFEHCVADVFYFAAAVGAGGALPAKAVSFLFAATLGNTIGAVIMCALSPRDLNNA